MDSPSATSSPVGLTFDAQTFKKINPVEFHRKFISQNVRTDGRTLLSSRDLHIGTGTISSVAGSSMVRIGQSSVICGVRAEVAEPKPDSPNFGFIVPNLELSPLCSPKFRPGPPGEEAQVTSQRLFQIITCPAVFDLSSLCIHAGSAVWVLYADILCLNYDGNIFDAALLALVAALRHVKLPQATFDEEAGIVKAKQERTIPLALKANPISVSFGVFDQKQLILDPNDEEEALMSTSVSLVLDSQSDRVLGVHKLGGPAISADTMRTCFDVARAEVARIDKQMEKACSNPLR